MIIVFIHLHEALLLLKATWKTPIVCVILCQCLGAVLCIGHPLPTPWACTSPACPGAGYLEGWREPRFIYSRKGSKYFISWLCGFAASIRVCFCVRGLQTLLSNGPAGNTSRNTGNVSDAEEGDLGLFQPAKRNVASSAQGSIEAAACFVPCDLEPLCFFHLVTGQRWGTCQCVVSTKACARKRLKSSLQMIVKDSDNWQQQTHLVAWYHV